MPNYTGAAMGGPLGGLLAASARTGGGSSYDTSMGRRSSRGAGATYGSLDEMKAMAKTPEDLERIHMDADGRYYLTDRPDPMDNLTGVGADMANARAAHRGAMAGPEGRKQATANFVKHGVNMGPVWDEVADLNRGRAATGYGQEHIPGADKFGPAQKAAGAAQAFSYDQAQGAQQDQRNQTLQGLLDGLKKARGGYGG